MTNIKEVARTAHVSVGTVSNVVSGTVPVSQRLRERVLDAIRELDYHPDHIARSLKIRQTRTIGLVISDITDPCSPQVMRGAEDAAWGANYTLITLNSRDQPNREEQALDALRNRRVDGILLLAAAGSNPARIEATKQWGIPLVCLDRDLAGAGVDSVVVNYYRGARDAVRHLASLGHRRIGLLERELSFTAALDRRAGYRQGLEDAGLSYDPNLLAAAGPAPEDAESAARELLLRSPRPSSIVSAGTTLAVGLLRAARELGLRCPDELAIVSFDDPICSEAVFPALTSIVQPSYEVGRKGFELLLRRMQDPARPQTKILLETTLHIRESCGQKARQVPSLA